MPQTEFIGKGSISNLGEILSDKKPRNIFLVTGKTSYEKCGAKRYIDQELNDYDFAHFNGFTINLKIEDVEKGLELYKKNNFDLIIAIGGGSVVDMGKLIRIFGSNKDRPLDYIKNGKKIEEKGAPLIAIPTTAGSGSEATHFAVVYVNGKKYSLTHQNIRPNYSIVDPQFTKSLSRKQLAYSGADVLCQAIESYWSKKSNEKSRRYSSEAITLTMKYLPTAVNELDENSKKEMAIAAHLAGKAIDITKTTAPHALSYYLTKHYDVPHGQAAIMTLPEMLEYNMSIAETTENVGDIFERTNEILELIGVDNVKQGKTILQNFIKNLGLKTRLSELGVKAEDIGLIAGNVNIERLGNHPVSLTDDDLKRILSNVR